MVLMDLLLYLCFEKLFSVFWCGDMQCKISVYMLQKWPTEWPSDGLGGYDNGCTAP